MSDTLPRLARIGVAGCVRSLWIAGAVVWCAVSPVSAQERDEEGFRVAMGLVQRGLHDDAAQQLVQFLRAQPDHRLAREAWYRLGVCYQELEESEQAAQAFQQALAKRGPLALLPECRYRLGNTWKGMREFDQARSAYRGLVESVPQDHYLIVPALYAEGECLRELGRLEQALESFRAAAQSPDESGRYGMPALYQAGFALMRLERLGEASATFGAAAERFPEHEAAGECRYLQGDAAFRAADLDRAEQAYGLAVEAGGDFVDDALMGLAWCRLEREQEDGALDLFRRVAEGHSDSPHAPKARLEAGRIVYRRGSYDEALRELAPLVGDGVAPDIRTAALELQGLALLDKDDGESAVERLTEAVRMASDDATRSRLFYELGETFAALGKWEDALAAYSEAEARTEDPELRGDVFYGQSLALHRLGRFEDSLGRARAMLKGVPNHRLAAHARFSVAENLFATKRYDKADEVYGSVPQEHELAAKAEYKRAWCAFLANHAAAAAERFGAIAGKGNGFSEEALSMAALAHLNAGQMDEALGAADRYRARHREGAYLARTERVAARVLRESGDLSGASQRLSASAAAETSEEQAARDQREQAEMQMQQGDFEGARKLYAPLAQRGDQVGARALEGLAWCAFELGDDETSLTRTDEALAHPEVGDARAGLLELRLAVLHRSEAWDEAVATAEIFAREFNGHPSAAEVQFGLGIALARKGDQGRARSVFAAVAESGAFDRQDELYYEWAWACRRDGDEPAALEAFAKVAELSDQPDRAGEAKLHLGLAALQEDDDSAQQLLSEVQGEHRPQALYRIAFSLLERGAPAEALPPLEEILAGGTDQPLYLESLFLAGEALHRAARHDEAVQRYAALLRAAPEHERGQLARLHGGQSLVRVERAADAAALLEEYLQRGGGSTTEQAQAHLWLGRARAARNEHDRAEAAYAVTTNLSEGELAAEAQFRIGEVRRAKGDLEGAVDAFVKLAILYGHEEWIRRGLLESGLCYEELQQPIKAAKFFRELVERFPDSEQSELARARLAVIEG